MKKSIKKITTALCFSCAVCAAMGLVACGANSAKAHNDTQKYISIGNTQLLESANLKGEYKEEYKVLGASGLKIKTLGNTAYLYGISDTGALNAVYDFMQIMFNYECYDENLWEIDRVSSVKMRNFDVVDVPDAINGTFASEAIGSDHSELFCNRMRRNNSEFILCGDTEYGGKLKAIHNSFQIFSKNNPTVAENEGTWFSDKGSQLCYTARGDEESYKKMVKHGASIIEQGLIRDADKDPTVYWACTFTTEDVPSMCGCPACKANETKYGAAAASVIIFMNNIMEEIERWWETEEGKPYYREEFYLLFFAYSGCAKCPATYNEETKKYELNEDLTIHPRVGTFLCNDKFNSMYSVYHEVNDNAREQWTAWLDVSNRVTTWMYDNNFKSDVDFWDSYGHYNDEGYDFYLANNPRNAFVEMALYSEDRTGFQGLKRYIQSKKFWDSQGNKVEDLIDKWFNATFGASSNVMRQLFDKERLYNKSVYDKRGSLNTGGFLITVDNKSYWSLSTTKEWLALLDRAYAINEKVNANDPAKLATIKRNIDKEFMYPAYIILKFYSYEEAPTTYSNVVKYCRENSEYFSEQEPFSELATVWENAVIGE